MNDQPTDPEGQTRTLSPLMARLIGLGLLLCGAVLGYLSIYTPLHDARLHAANVEFSDKEVGFAPVLILLSLMLIVFPRMATWDTVLVTKNKKLSVVGWLIVAVMLAIGVGTYIWFHAQLKALGYGS